MGAINHKGGGRRTFDGRWYRNGRLPERSHGFTLNIFTIILATVAFVSLASVVDAPLNSGGEIERRKERRY